MSCYLEQAGKWDAQRMAESAVSLTTTASDCHFSCLFHLPQTEDLTDLEELHISRRVNSAPGMGSELKLE